MLEKLVNQLITEHEQLKIEVEVLRHENEKLRYNLAYCLKLKDQARSRIQQLIKKLDIS